MSGAGTGSGPGVAGPLVSVIVPTQDQSTELPLLLDHLRGREAFERLGGYRPLPIMDDYDFARRLEDHGRTTCLPGPALTSSRRWRRLGIARTVASWLVIRYRRVR